MANGKYSGARLKIDRAKQHINTLQRLARSIPRLAYSVSIEPHPNTGHHSVKFKSDPPGPIFSLVFGDAVTNLRSALDHCYAAAIGAGTNTTGQVFFPIRDKREALIGSLQKGAKQQPIPKALYDLILDEIRPHEGGHPTLCALNKLANTDKHRLLIAIAGLAAVTVSYKHGGVTIEDCTFASQAGNQLVLSTGPGAIEFKGETKATLEIRLGEREPRIFHGKPVIPTLLGLADDVGVIVGKIEKAVP